MGQNCTKQKLHECTKMDEYKLSHGIKLHKGSILQESKKIKNKKQKQNNK